MFCGQNSESIFVTESGLYSVNEAVTTGLCYSGLGDLLFSECTFIC